MATSYSRLDKSNAAVLLVDHQAGLLSLVRDLDPDAFKNNVLALADLAKYFGLPTILTTSFEDGPNGPLVPERTATIDRTLPVVIDPERCHRAHKPWTAGRGRYRAA
jgi:nicotinamidase-related amidase